jgi:hypothetical protein
MNLLAKMSLGSPRWPSAGAAEPHSSGSHRTPGAGAFGGPDNSLSGRAQRAGGRRIVFSMMKALPILVSISTILLLTACSKLTEDNLQKIQPGMTTAEVKAILGEPTSSQTGNMLGLVSGTTYVYHTDKSDVKISFVNDKVVTTEGNFQ